MSSLDRFPRALDTAERAVLSRYLGGSGASGHDVLLSQLPYVTVIGGRYPTLDLAVNTGGARAAAIEARGPLAPRMFAVGPGDELWGEVMTWVTNGYLSVIGLAWWNDDLPRCWESVGVTKFEWELPVEQ